MQTCTSELLTTLKDCIASENQNVSIENAMFLSQVLDCLFCVNHQSDKKIAEIGLTLFENYKVSSKPELDLKEAFALMHSFILTKNQMWTIKSHWPNKGVFFPNMSNLLEARKR